MQEGMSEIRQIDTNKGMFCLFLSFGKSGLVGYIGRFPGQTRLGTWPGLGTQPRCKTFSDLGAQTLIERSD